MSTLADAKAGDDIVMVYRTGTMQHGKSTDRTVKAILSTAKPVNLTIVADAPGNLVWKVRRDTGKEPGNATMYGWRAYTAGEYADIQAERDAWDFLHKQGISVSSNSPWRKQRPLLAELIRAALTPVEEDAA